MKTPPPAAISTLLGVALLVAVGAVAYAYSGATRDRAAAEATLASTTAELAAATQQSVELAASLEAERARSAELEKEKGKAEKKVDKLEDLAKLDPELLQKYSKVYFLNENYEPSDLDGIGEEYLADSALPQQVHEEAGPHLEKMIEDAADEDVTIRVISGYRSFETQRSLKGNYVATFGIGANAFSAEQGYSEHQLGTAVDLTTPSVGGTYLSFADSLAYDWLAENAYRYGFILSYPAGNSYYIYEPWHWRYVGIKLATDLHKKGKYFYDLDQRTIDTYLASIFD